LSSAVARFFTGQLSILLLKWQCVNTKAKWWWFMLTFYV